MRRWEACTASGPRWARRRATPSTTRPARRSSTCRAKCSSGLIRHRDGGRRLRLLPHIEEQQGDADADGGVGDVEGRPVVRLSAGVDEDVHEIGDVAEVEAVDEI